jgi:hypothetical protein
MKQLHENPLRLVPQDLLPLLPGFLERRKREVIQLKAMLNSQDFIGIKDVGHRLKGTGTGYGFPVITRIGGELEVAAKLGNSQTIAKCVDELSMVTENILGFLHS